MGDEGKEMSAAHKPTDPNATVDAEGYWKRENGDCLPVSASDLERYTYCPLSWSLAAHGHAGQGEEIIKGQERHKAIHHIYSEYQHLRIQTKRNLLIWQWWYAIVLLFVVDAVLFRGFSSSNFDTDEFSKLLATWALSCLVVGISALLLPWRKFIGMEIYQDSNIHFSTENKAVVEPYFEPRDFKGGWFEGGRIEVAFFMAAIVMALHSIALRFASDKEQAAYVFAFIAICWTLMASIQLQRALVANSKSLDLADENNIAIGTEVAYSDDESTSDLLVDGKTGLRGRPDQIVIIDGEFIPVEQKTGKVPKRPHDSHSMQVLAYAHLIETTTGRAPPYGILRYGEEDLHVIDWNAKTKVSLFERIKTIQQVMAQGGAARNHNRPGKCKNCSRRYACPDPLDP